MKTVVKSTFMKVLGGLSLSFALMAQAPTYTISTISGSVPVFNLEDTSSSSPVQNPLAIVIDKSGNVYFADTNNNRIRKIDATTGAVTTIAGTGAVGSSGDGAAATKALLNVPA